MDVKAYNKGVVNVACDHLLKRLREHGRIVSPSKYLREFAGQADANERKPASSLTLGIFDEATDFWVVDLQEKYPEYLHIIEEFIKNFFTKIGEAAAEFDFHAEMVCYTSIPQRQMRQKSSKIRNEA